MGVQRRQTKEDRNRDAIVAAPVEGHVRMQPGNQRRDLLGQRLAIIICRMKGFDRLAPVGSSYVALLPARTGSVSGTCGVAKTAMKSPMPQTRFANGRRSSECSDAGLATQL